MESKLGTSQFEHLDVSEIPIFRLSKFRGIVVLLLELTVSITLPLIAFLIYVSYAKSNGIVLESGCEGPESAFGMMSGILFALIQRFKISLNS